MAHQLASLWFRANCIPGMPISELLRQIDGANSRHQACWFQFGSNHMLSDNAWLIHIFKEELFAFALTPEQAKRSGLQPNDIKGQTTYCRRLEDPPSTSVATLNSPDVRFDRDGRISGCIEYTTVSLEPRFALDQLCLRVLLEWHNGLTLISYHYPRMAARRGGRIEFDFNVANDIEQRSVPMTLGFFTLVTRPRVPGDSNVPAPVQPLSDTCGVLIDMPRDGTVTL